MKNLYNTKSTKRIHPSPPPPTLLSAVPSALLALAAALSADEQEALAYLLGCSGNQPKNNHHLGRKKAHPPQLGCPCFSCYKSFWARWDSSPNRHVIHLIIDAFEDTLIDPNNHGNKSIKNKKKKKKKMNNKSSEQKKDEVFIEQEDMKVGDKLGDGHHDHHHDDDGDDDEEMIGDEEGKSSVRKFVSWVFGLTN